jgi:hypothetical protein
MQLPRAAEELPDARCRDGSFSEQNYRWEQPVIAGATIDRSFA